MCSMYIVQLIWYKLQLKTLKHSGSVDGGIYIQK